MNGFERGMIDRRAFLKCAGLAAAGWAAGLTAGRAAEEAGGRRPNVIIILADDLGWGDLGCYPKGAEWGTQAHVATPHLDQFAASGIRFTDGYATHMVCTPSRAGLLSGRYQQRIGFYQFADTAAGLPKEVKLLPETLRDAGYATGLIGKWHLGYPKGRQPLDRGFERFYGFLGGQHEYYLPNMGEAMFGAHNAPDGFVFDQEKPVRNMAYLTDELTERAMEFMGSAVASNRPFFLYLAYSAPHPPMQSRWEDLAPFANGKGEYTYRDLARAMIVRLDTQIGRIMEWLRQKGVEEETLVVFSSDNGGHDDGPMNCVQHNGGLRGRKGYFFEGGIRVPFIIRWPGKLPAGKVYSQPVSHLDLYPTVLAAAGIQERPPALDGVDLLPFLSGTDSGVPHKRLFWAERNPNAQWAIREGKWKLVHEDFKPSIDQKVGPPQLKVGLFDLENDPFEKHNLATRHPDRVRAMTALMKKFHASMAPSVFTKAEQAAQDKRLKERQDDPALKDWPLLHGAPGHWKNARNPNEVGIEIGPEDRIEDKATAPRKR